MFACHQMIAFYSRILINNVNYIDRSVGLLCQLISRVVDFLNFNANRLAMSCSVHYGKGNVKYLRKDTLVKHSFVIK